MKTIGTKLGLRVLGGLLVGLGITAGCSSTTTEGTNTNWLECHEDVDCVDAGVNAICVEERCVSRGAAGGAPTQGAGGGGHIDVEGGACTRAPRSEPCRPGFFDCLFDFRQVRSLYPRCFGGIEFTGPYLRDCGGYDGLAFPRMDTDETLYFDKTDGQLAGEGHTAMTSASACQWYDPGFTVPSCAPNDPCPGKARGVVARAYDAQRDCYEKPVELNLRIQETEPTSSGLKEIVCVKVDDGTRYAVWKGYTEYISLTGFTKLDPVVYGRSGFYEMDVDTDAECGKVITRGAWDVGGGIGTGELITADAGDHAGECP